MAQDLITRTSVAAILLAAGESTRMAETKALLPWQGVPLVRYQVEQLSGAGASEVVIVLGHKANELQKALDEGELPSYAHTVVNKDYRQGKTTSIKAGLRSIREPYRGVVQLAVDQPRPGSVLRRLIEAHLAGGNMISIPSHEGKLGHPPIFDAALVTELLEITEEKEGIREIIERHRQRVREVPIESAVVLTNLNTKEEYQSARRVFG